MAPYKHLAIICSLFIAGCGGDSSSDVASTPAQPTESPTQLSANLTGSSVELSWQHTAGADRHDLYYAEEVGMDVESYAAYQGGTLVIDVSTPYTLNLVDASPVYHFAVTATIGGAESQPSNVAVVIPRYQSAGANSEYVRDLTTNLEWSRCLYGQTWNLATWSCLGVASRVNTSQGQAAASAASMSVPTKDQIESLVYCSSGLPDYFSPVDGCGDNDLSPAILSSQFPNTSVVASYLVTTSCGFYDGDPLMWTFDAPKGRSSTCVQRNHPDIGLHLRMVRPF
jgi:hypothetical protein